MYIKSIELKNFRNYNDLNISFNERVNILMGNNAQGKTNLLEGIYLNSIGKSFKSVRDKELVMFGEEFCRVKTTYVRDDEERVNEIVISNTGVKGIKADGVKLAKASELLDKVYIIVFSPEDLKIVKDEPEKRRKFIDRELCQIRRGYLADLNSYKKVLKQRNTYLKESRIDDGILDIWDYELAEYGAKIIKKRSEFVKQIDEISRDIHTRLTGGKEELKIEYRPSIFSEENIKEYFYQELVKHRDDDKRNGNTSKGPHKDDIKISADGINLRKFGSQGQQRTAALSLKLSEIKIIEEETNEKPILLLDDVLSELDNDRQTYLMNSLGENQMFITTTDLIGQVARNLPNSKIVVIKNGMVDTEI